jgi:cell wall-associated NlpC family hydrolase
MILKKSSCVVLFFAAAFTFSAANTFGQVYSRPRIVPPTATTNQPANTQKTSQPTTQPKGVMQRPVLTNQIAVVNQPPPQSLVKKTADSRPVSPVVSNYASLLNYNSSVNQRMIQSIQEKYGIRYVYGSQGPNSYDCSGFVWSVFQTAGIPFERGSAKTLWANSYPALTDAEKYQFGTLVFFNRLGHVGIVADQNGFYHASSSKGITYSKFEGYWGKRIVGFRRLPNTGF